MIMTFYGSSIDSDSDISHITDVTKGRIFILSAAYKTNSPTYLHLGVKCFLPLSS